MFLPENKKQSTAEFFDPKSEKEAKRKRMLAELLIQKGNAPQRNEQAGGMTVARSPWENINQSAEKYMGEYNLGKAEEQTAESEIRRQKMIQEALGQQDPMQAAQVLAQDPNTSDAAIKMYSDVLSDNRRMDQLRAVGSRAGATPAPIQVANRMFELEQKMNNPSIPQDERFLAQREYSLLGQSAKTYGFDRGIEAGGSIQGYDQVFGQQQPNVNTNPTPFVPQQGMQDLQGQDPVQDHLNAVMQQQQQTGINPMQRPNLAQQSPVQPIQGFNDIVSANAAQKKGAEEQAKLQQQLDYNPQIKAAERASTLSAERSDKDITQQRAKTRVTGNLNRLASAYNRLNEMNGVASTDKGVLSNLKARASSSQLGQGIGAALGTEAQSVRNEISALRPSIVNDIRQAAEMGAKGMDSERELEFFLKAATDPTRDIQSNMTALAVLDDAYGLGSNIAKDPAMVQNLYKEFQQNLGTVEQQQPQQENREQLIEKLRSGNFPEERIQQFLQSRGM